MPISELIKSLKSHKDDLMKQLSFVKGKHDALIEEIAYLNSIINELTGANKQVTEDSNHDL